MSSPRFISFRSLQLAALLLLGGATAFGQGFTGKIPDASETPLERAKRAREELALRMQDEANGVGLETLEEKVERLTRELTAAEAALAEQLEVAKQAAAVKVASGALVVVSEGGTSQGAGFITEMRERTFFVTNIHVLGVARGASVKTLDGVDLELPPHCYISRYRDLAIVPIEWDGPRLSLSQSLSFDEVRVGQAVAVIGNSKGESVPLEGQIKSVGETELEVMMNSVPRSSGSPIIYKEAGRVVGIVSHVKDMTSSRREVNRSSDFRIRCFGERLDGDIEWRMVALEELYEQAEVYYRYEERTRVMNRIGQIFLRELGGKDDDELSLEKQLKKYKDHDSLGYLCDYFDRDFQWFRGGNTAHNKRLLKRYVTSLLSEIQTDRKGTNDALEIDFYKRRYNSIDDERDDAIRALTRFQDSRLAL